MGASTVRRWVNLDDARRAGLKRLPAAPRGYLDGGAEDHVALARNRAAFGEAQLVPQLLRDVSAVDASTTLLGAPSSWPFFLGPTGFNRLFHRQGEFPVARAAAAAGIPYSLSSVGSATIEDIAALSANPLFFQIYVFRDAGLNAEVIARAKATGVHALILTVDVPVHGNRETDLRTGMTVPPTFSARSFVSFALHPRWVWDYLTGYTPTIANFASEKWGGGDARQINKLFTPAVTWQDAARMVEAWDGPFAVKGLLSPRDAMRAAEIGASAVILSNHGGRQLDAAPSPFDVLPEVMDAVGDRLEVILDSGVRRGGDVLKAIALGARGVSFGRPYLYGLAAAGEAGVARVISILASEVERDMALMGCASLDDVTPDHVRWRHGRR